ncbi:MAG: hypothetical protein AB7S26_07535 [Sandaracinaceae bacterium]
MSALRSVSLVAKDAERYGAWELGPAYRTSLPIPLGGKQREPRFAFLLAKAEMTRRGKPPSLFPPRAVMSLRASDGLILDIRHSPPSFFGLDVREDAPLGHELPGHERLSDEQKAKREAYYEVLDELAPVFFGLADKRVEELRALETELRAGLEGSGQAPLLPFQLALGRRFFAWLEER